MTNLGILTGINPPLIQVMENIMKSGGVVSEDLIKILAEHCRDSSLMVRKLMVGSLTELVKVSITILTIRILSLVNGVFAKVGTVR